MAYGARNLRRTIQKDVDDPIAQRIIESFVEPLHTIRVGVTDGKVSLETN